MLEELRGGGRASDGLRRRWRSGLPPQGPTTRGSPPSSRPGWPRPASTPRRAGPARCREPPRRASTWGSRGRDLRYGENPHQAAARYRAAGADLAGPSRPARVPLQGKELSYNNLLDASAAAALARELRGPACVIVKHGNPCGAAEGATLARRWAAALAGDPVTAFGGVVALPTRSTSRAHGLGEDVPRGRRRARLRRCGPRILAAQAESAAADRSRGLGRRRPTARRIRSAGGAMLVTAAERRRTTPAPGITRRAAARRRGAARPRPRLARRPPRRVERDRAGPRPRGGRDGAGQISRVDSARGGRRRVRWPASRAPGRGVHPTRSSRSRTGSTSARGRRDRVRPARRLDARRGGDRCRRGGRRHDASHGGPALPALTRGEPRDVRRTDQRADRARLRPRLRGARSRHARPASSSRVERHVAPVRRARHELGVVRRDRQGLSGRRSEDGSPADRRRRGPLGRDRVEHGRARLPAPAIRGGANGGSPTPTARSTTGVDLIELRAGKVWRETVYWAPPFDAPEWRRPFVELREGG